MHHVCCRLAAEIDGLHKLETERLAEGDLVRLKVAQKF